MVFPDYLPVVEVWLVCCGFTEAKSLAMKINTFFKLINEQVTAFFSFEILQFMFILRIIL